MRKLPEPVNVTEVYLNGINERLDAIIKLLQDKEDKDVEVLVASVTKETANIRTPRKKKGE